MDPNGCPHTADPLSLGWSIAALSVGQPAETTLGGKRLRTSICKTTATGSLRLTLLGLEGDGVGNRRYHGGEDKALCVYGATHYPFWEQELGRPLPSAAFGENLTLANPLGERRPIEALLCIGDILGVGDVRVQVTQPRQPCATLALRLGCTDLVARVIQTGRCGLYLRVLVPGALRAGDRLMLLKRDPRGITVARAHRVRHLREDGEAGLRELLAVPGLSESWREELSRRLDR